MGGKECSGRTELFVFCICLRRAEEKMRAGKMYTIDEPSSAPEMPTTRPMSITRIAMMTTADSKPNVSASWCVVQSARRKLWTGRREGAVGCAPRDGGAVVAVSRREMHESLRPSIANGKPKRIDAASTSHTQQGTGASSRVTCGLYDLGVA
jgi:hypothetical protein